MRTQWFAACALALVLGLDVVTLSAAGIVVVHVLLNRVERWYFHGVLPLLGQ